MHIRLWVSVLLAVLSLSGAVSASSASSGHSCRWRAARVEDPHAHLFDRFNAVTVTSSGRAWAVGDYFTGHEGGPNGALIEEWTGRRWRLVGHPLPNATGWSVSASGDNDAWALGDQLLEHWNGHGWRKVATARFRGSHVLHAIATREARDAWAVGERWRGNGKIGKTLAEHWNGKRWSVVATPNPSASSHRYDAILQAVTIRSASDAWAVGYRLTGRHGLVSRTLIMHWNGQRWRIVASPSVRAPSDVLNNILFSVSADARNDAWTVGSWGSQAGGYGGKGDHALVLHWNGRRWSRATLPAIRERNMLLGVTAHAGHAWAVGDRGEQPRQRPLIERWDGTHWTMAQSPSGFDLAGVSLLSHSRSWAVGAAGRRPLAAQLVCGQADQTGVAVALAPWAHPLAFGPLSGWHHGASGTVIFHYDHPRPNAPAESTAWIARNVRYRSPATADPPNKTLAHLPRNGLVIWAVIFRGHPRGQPTIRLDVRQGRHLPCCDGQRVAGGVSELDGAGPGHAYTVIVRVYFGSFNRALRVQAQKALSRLKLPPPR